MRERWRWNEDDGNYCAAKKVGRGWAYIEPLVRLKVNEKEMDEESFMTVVQMIFYKRMGKIRHSFYLSDFVSLARFRCLQRM